jgi:hypothetical protein
MLTFLRFWMLRTKLIPIFGLAKTAKYKTNSDCADLQSVPVPIMHHPFNLDLNDLYLLSFFAIKISFMPFHCGHGLQIRAIVRVRHISAIGLFYKVE